MVGFPVCQLEPVPKFDGCVIKSKMRQNNIKRAFDVLFFFSASTASRGVPINKYRKVQVCSFRVRDLTI